VFSLKIGRFFSIGLSKHIYLRIRIAGMPINALSTKKNIIDITSASDSNWWIVPFSKCSIL
jgi:hypothetical protein